MPATQPKAVNYWPDSKCAKAFWQQADLPPYQELLADTVDLLEPKPGERWLDLGCGGGQLTRSLWKKSGGRVAIVGLDCAALNQKSYDIICASVSPTPKKGQITFVAEDFSGGLRGWEDGQFAGVMAGLSIQYAESYSDEEGWNTKAYDALLARVNKLLQPGGTFVFSVNVPEPSWLKVGLKSVLSSLFMPRPLRYFRNVLRMMQYGRWIKREARTGRFHYLPAKVVTDKLARAGFTAIEYRLSFAKQAYIFRCRRPA